MSKANPKTLTGILCTFDTLKRDAEINPARFVQKEDVACGVKFLIGCSEEDIQVIRIFHEGMHTFYVPKPLVVKP